MLDFNNTEIAFSAKTDGELQNAKLLFSTIQYPWLVKCAKVASNIAIKIHFPLAWAVKPTLYKQFVGGETLQDCTKTIEHLKHFNVKSTLDFSAESEQTPDGIQATFEETMRSIDFAKGNPNLAYAVFKPSTITTDDLLAKASEKRGELSIEEVKQFREFRDRFMAFCQRAYDNDVRILVDAEDYCFQDAIDELRKWDVILLQAGTGDTANNMNQEVRKFLVEYVDSVVKHPHTFWWHTTWFNSTDPALYIGANTTLNPATIDQVGQLKASIDAAKAYVMEDPMFEGRICSGTPMMYALKKLNVPETDLYRDHTHLNDYGSLLVGYSFYTQYTGKEVTQINLDVIPRNLRIEQHQSLGDLQITEEMKQIIIQTAQYTKENPWVIPEQ